MKYFDYASTTPVDKRVLKSMEPFFTESFENPSGLYQSSRKVKTAIEKSRQKIANFIGSRPEEIIFTSGGTESDNLAIFGIADQFKSGKIITSRIEHPAVLNACKKLEQKGFNVIYLNVNKEGIVDLDELEKELTKDTVLVSIMYANNEIGTIQPIKKISKIISEFRKKNQLNFPLFHTDACQAAPYLDMNVNRIGVDFLTLNGSKIYAPKGIGVLFKKETIKISPQMIGGGQENNLRAGTENVPSIIGLAKAVELISEKESLREMKLRDYLISELLKIENVSLNGSIKKRLPNNINITVKGVEGESALLYLDKEGIAISTGSACSSKSLKPSHVILALYNDDEIAHSSLRITLGRFTTKSEVEYLIKTLRMIIPRLRRISGI